MDLPAPFSPTMAWIVPAGTANEMPSFATTPGNRFTMSRTSMAGARDGPTTSGATAGASEPVGAPASSLTKVCLADHSGSRWGP